MSVTNIRAVTILSESNLVTMATMLNAPCFLLPQCAPHWEYTRNLHEV